MGQAECHCNSDGSHETRGESPTAEEERTLNGTQRSLMSLELVRRVLQGLGTRKPERQDFRETMQPGFSPSLCPNGHRRRKQLRSGFGLEILEGNSSCRKMVNQGENLPQCQESKPPRHSGSSSRGGPTVAEGLRKPWSLLGWRDAEKKVGLYGEEPRITRLLKNWLLEMCVPSSEDGADHYLRDLYKCKGVKACAGKEGPRM